MGKLHTLRRAIQREPEKWFRWYQGFWGNEPPRITGVCGARFSHHKRHPDYKKGYFRPDEHGDGYKNFVRKTLRELGYSYPQDGV